jgi:hypothetical protein
MSAFFLQEVVPIDGIWVLFASLAVIAGFLALLAWAAARARRRGISGSTMGVFDQMWHPAAAESHLEIQLESERKKPLPSPDDL